MIIGLDLDNTIVCYDDLFPSLARERGLVPDDVAATKHAVRAHLRSAGREIEWTRLQGEVYGPSIGRARPFAGARDFVKRSRGAGVDVVIISHKTAVPIVGEPWDLIAAARGWLEVNGFFDDDDGLPRSAAFFEATKRAKLARIVSCGCTHFVDDLPELLDDPAFPPHVRGTLFDPHRQHPARAERTETWAALADRLLP
ncbi:MAG: haloacid dehalogenase-like hydrolase [Deltaproteobacteria bacterium]|nr:haloacid dehalogenase-like hydrolase [Deltaproteobacteria bacterium]